MFDVTFFSAFVDTSVESYDSDALGGLVSLTPLLARGESLDAMAQVDNYSASALLLLY